jgi:DNA-binding response OmpR family regulator
MLSTVLIAAHDPWFLQLLRMYTEESGFRAVQVDEGQDVLPMVRQENPIAVLLQVDLPGHLKGWDVLKVLHDEKGVCMIPVLLFTWHDQTLPKDVLASVAAHLQEPIAFETFVDTLQKIGLKPTRQNPPHFSEPSNQFGPPKSSGH